MRVTRVTLRDLRSYERAEVALGPGVTIVHGPNGAGKTNLLEAVYLGCTGRSCRTNNDRELVRFGVSTARVELTAEDDDAGLVHELSVGFEPGVRKRLRADGLTVERFDAGVSRPLVAVFLPDRLELVKGPPAVRRAHVDQVVAALWPARATARRSYGRALAQRNALIARIRAGGAAATALGAWNAELARAGIELMAVRGAAIGVLVDPFARHAEQLGLDGEPAVAYRPRSRAGDAAELAAELGERLDADLERGFTTHGPHRDELALVRSGRALRTYGSQGQQRLAVLALLLAEREALASTRGAPPLMLLDDVASELDADRRAALLALLRTGGQSVITTTALDDVPGGHEPDVARVEVRDGRVACEPAVAPSGA